MVVKKRVGKKKRRKKERKGQEKKEGEEEKIWKREKTASMVPGSERSERKRKFFLTLSLSRTLGQ